MEPGRCQRAHGEHRVLQGAAVPCVGWDRGMQGRAPHVQTSVATAQTSVATAQAGGCRSPSSAALQHPRATCKGTRPRGTRGGETVVRPLGIHLNGAN